MKIFGVAIIFFLFVDASFGGACQGYAMNIKQMTQGAANRAIFKDGAIINLTDDCIVSLDGSLTLSQSFGNATISYQVNISLFSKSDKNVDLCKAIDEDLGWKGIYPCPVTTPGEIVSRPEATIDLSYYSYLLGLAGVVGDLTINAQVNYDGATSDTFTIVVTISKKALLGII